MTVNEFAQKAREGGFDWDRFYSSQDTGSAATARLMLSVEAWKAVGKVEGWGRPVLCTDGTIRTFDHAKKPEWLKKMHGLIDALAEGKDIETYLSEIV